LEAGYGAACGHKTGVIASGRKARDRIARLFRRFLRHRDETQEGHGEYSFIKHIKVRIGSAGMDNGDVRRRNVIEIKACRRRLAGIDFGPVNNGTGVLATSSRRPSESSSTVADAHRRAEHAGINDQYLNAQRAKALFHKQNLIALGSSADQRNPAARVPINAS
jgi:hypothetical protein